jgi:hypothetical protein
MKHLRLHNGTLWRWNRPLLDFENGEPSLRIEQRVVPAGPTILDSFANAAFYYGLTHALYKMESAPEEIMDFAQARDNFYTCAQHGLEAHIIWLDGEKHPAKSLLHNVLLPLAKEGLTDLGIYNKDISKYLSIISGRARTGRNGASWQRAFVAKYGDDMKALLTAYMRRQHSGKPVHEWDL